MASKLHVAIKPNSHIQELQVESRELAEAHADVSNRCFQIYTPILAAVADQYQTNFEACVTAFDNSTAAVNEKYSKDRQSVLEYASKGCATSYCSCWTAQKQDLDTVISRLECASTNSAKSSKIFYGISANATEIAVKITEEYQVLASRRDICMNNADRIYVEDTTDTYEKLNNCLKGRDTQPPSAPEIYTTTPCTTTTKTTTTTTTTIAPVTKV
uniref:Uncharacterized protein LOC108051431 isoform X2 n=1 Tax=Drosophila rhopaloa TaxID=1041015 RepID=A0A6P4FI91_DRORH